jgi:hypothetical protein
MKELDPEWTKELFADIAMIDWGALPEGRNGTEGPVIARDAWFCEQLDKNPKPWMRQNGLVNLRMWILLKTRYFYSNGL